MDLARVLVSELEGKELDYWVYRCAADQLGKNHDLAAFHNAYAKGQFKFSQDRQLLLDLLETYQIRLQLLADEWLASNTETSQYGPTPLIAACRWLVCRTFGADFQPKNM